MTLTKEMTTMSNLDNLDTNIDHFNMKEQLDVEGVHVAQITWVDIKPNDDESLPDTVSLRLVITDGSRDKGKAMFTNFKVIPNRSKSETIKRIRGMITKLDIICQGAGLTSLKRSENIRALKDCVVHAVMSNRRNTLTEEVFPGVVLLDYVFTSEEQMKEYVKEQAKAKRAEKRAEKS